MASSKTGVLRPVKLPKVSEYVKNVGKSVGYAAVQGVKMNTPSMNEFMERNNEIFKEVYGGVKNYRQTIKQTEKAIRQSNVYRAIDTGVKNLINDAKTGKFYNDRTSDYSEEIIGVDGDYDIDFSVDGSASSDNKSSSSITPGEKMISDSVSDAIGAAAISQNSAVAEGTNLVVRANSANTKLIMSQMDRISARFTSGMGSVYSEIGKIDGFLNGPMMAHMENSRKYYEETTKLMRDNSMMLKELLEMQRNLYKAKNNNYKESNLDNSMLSSGMPDFSGYMKNIKSNARNFMDARGMGMLSSGMGNPLMAFAAAPFQMVMEAMANRILPKEFKKSLKSLDQGVSGLFPQLIAKLNKARDEEGGILGILGELFGIQIDKKNKINVSNYKKDAVPFDGITRQAIIETIPGYLSRIEAALTGSEERHYDFQAGSWKSAKQIEKEFANEKKNSIMQANFGARQDLNSLVNDADAKNAAAAASLKRGINKMFEKIFDDGGDFNDKMPGAWMYYGFSSEAQFKAVVSQLSKKSIRKFALENMKARQNLSGTLKRNEQNGGTYRHMFNGAYDMSGEGNGSKKNPSDFTMGGSGLLAMSKDNDGHNIFYYLKKITDAVQFRGGRKGKNKSGKNNKNKSSNNNQSNSSSNSSSSSDSGEDGDPGGDEDLDWASYEENVKKQEEKSKKSTKYTDKLKEVFGDTKIAKSIGGLLDSASSLVKKPMDYMTKMIEKADKNLFHLMFGEKVDADGNPYDSVFDYVIDQIKQSFKEVSEYVKKIFDPLKDKLKEWFKPMWDKFGAPVLDELKGMGRRAKDRVKQGVDNTFGKAYRAYDENRRYQNLKDRDVYNAPRTVIDSNDIKNNAMGGLVTKRGLTMISPGEMIIPASFDKREQRRMLMEEKKEKNRIMNAISFHAEGTVDTEQMKANLKKIYDENRGKGAKNAAGGIAGAGVGLLTGVNPLLGAMAGAGLSILSNSESFQKVIFGDEATGKKGLVPQKVQDFFKKAAPDMGDFGIAGGILGLLTPFGPLGGAVIGAGVGMLKNSETFQKFIFGDEATGKDGLMSKKTYDKFKNMVSKAVPNMAVGAVGGALLGPFGILGNAVMGAGLGLLSSTDAFHDFVFGDKENPDKGSLMGAINRGIINPAKDKIAEILTSFKNYAKKNIIEPLKNFWEPFKQGIKNTVTGIAESIKDHVNDMFEKSIGIPLHDFLQEKIFKPLTKTFFNILKLPINLAKGALSLPFKALGFAGKNMRMKQIHKGKAYDMSAEERLQYRQEHSFRNGFFGRDKMKEQDEMLRAMTPEQLIALREGAANGMMSQRELQKDLTKKRQATGQAMSSFFNQKDENGKLRYDTAKYKNVKKITKLAEEGNMDEAMSMIDKLGLSDKDKAELKKKIEPKATAAAEALERMNRSKEVGGELDKEASKLLKRKFKGRTDRRQIFKSAEAELKARAKNKSSKEEESDETRATNNFAELYKGKADEIIKLFNTANTKLDHIINPDAAAKDTTPAGDKAAQIAKSADQEVDITKGAKNATTSAYTKVIKKAEEAAKDAAVKTANPVTGKPMNEDSKEYKEAEKKEEEKNAVNERIAKAVEDSNAKQEGFFNTLLGFKKGKKKEGGGILDKLGNGVGGFLRFLGVGAGGIASMGLKVIGIGAGVSLLGYASEWFKTSVWPTIKGALFGKENEDGTKTNGLLGGFGNTLHDLFYGKDGEPGVLAKAGNWIGEKLASIRNWWEKKGGLGGILCQDVLPKMINGWGLAMNNIVTPVVAVLFKHLPGMLLGLGKAILSGLKLAITSKEYSRNSSAKIEGGDAIKELQNITSSNNSSLSSAMGTLGGSIVNSYNTARSGMSDTAASAAEVDWSALYGSGNSEKNNEKSGGIDGLLGNTKRTNQIEYDKDGNIITTYTQNNENRSILGATKDAAGRGFLRGLAGDASGGVFARMANMGTKGTKIGFGSTGFLTKHGTGLMKKTGKGIGKTVTGVQDAGLGLNKWINRVSSDAITSRQLAAETGEKASTIMAELGGKAAANADDVAKAGTSFGGKIKNIFKKKTADVAETVSASGMKNVSKEVAKKGAQETGEAIVKQSVKAAASNGAEEATKKGMAAGIKKIFSSIATSDVGLWIFKQLSKAGTEIGENVFSNALMKVGDAIAKKVMGGGLIKKGFEKAAGAIAGFTPIGLGLMLADAMWGFNNAYTLLGVADVEGGYQVTIGQKIICALVHMLNSRFLFGIIPTETLIDIFLDYLAPILGINTDELNHARSDEEINRILDEWNKAHPDDQCDNLEDFNNRNKLSTKIKKKLGAAWEGTKSAVSNGVNNIKNGAINLGNSIKDGTINAAKAAVEQVKQFPKNTKDAISDAKNTVLSVMKGEFSIFNKKYWSFSESSDEDGNPLSLMSKIESSVFKFLSMPHAMIGYLGTKMVKGFKALVSGAKEGTVDAAQDVLNAMKGQYSIFSADYWKTNDQPDQENPISGIGKVIGFVERLIMAPKALMGWTISKAVKGFKALVSGAKEGTVDAAQDVLNAMKGQYSIFSADYWKTNDQEEGEEGSESNPISGIGKVIGFVERLIMAPKALMGWTISKVKEGFVNLISGAKEGSLDASSDIDAVSQGKYTIFSSDYWHSDSEDDENPLSGIGKVFSFITRLTNAPRAMIGYAMTKVKEGFVKLVTGAKDVETKTEEIIEKAKNGDISVFSKEYWKALDKDDNPLGLIGTVASFMTRLVNAPIVIFTKVFNKIKEKFDSIKGWFAKLFGEDAESVDEGGSGKGDQNGKGKFGYGKISQLDPSIASMSYNGHTMAQAGCGPVAATNLINNIKGNNGITVQQAAKYATKNGFKPKNDGTDPEYMSSILSASGIDNKKISGSGQISNSLKQGNPVVIMGKGDAPTSPYGNKSPHYITAMGYDKKGNIVVDDPYEKGYKSYKKSDVLNGAMKSVSAKAYGKFGFGMDEALKKKIISKTFEITNGAEGGYDTVIPNDNGSWSVGIAGFHGVKIKRLFEAMAAQLSGNAKSQALKYAGWSGKVLSSSEANEVKNFLNTNSTVSKQVQDAQMAEIVGGNIAVPLQMYDSGILKDYRSIILAGDIGNTGPAHLTNWKNKYKPTTSGDELSHVRDSLKSSDSWWGNQKGSKYYNGWMNRIDKTYNTLKDWSADGYTPSIGGSSSDGSSEESGKANTLMGALSNLGTSMVKAMFGADAYNAIYGSNDSSGSSSDSSGCSVSTSEVKRLDGSTVSGSVSSNEHVKKAQIAVANVMYSRQGKNNYSQNGKVRETQGSGGSDCSSMCSYAYRKALNNDSLTNQLMGSTLPGWSGYTQSEWNNGTLVDTNKNSNKFQVGDLLFWGNGNNTTHVEMYTGDDTIMGHGSGIGPTEKKLSTYKHPNAFMGGKRYLTEDIAKQAGYGKGGYGKGYSPTTNIKTGVAKSALERNSGLLSYSRNNYSMPSTTTVSNNNAVDYNTFLQTIVSILMNINDNTALLTKVIEILSDNFDIKIDKSDIEAAHSQTRAQTEKSLNELVRRSSGNTVGVSKLLNNKDTDYIITAMKALASE